MALNNGTLIHLVAREGKQDEVAAALGQELSAVARDPQTATWYAYRITNTEFGILDTATGSRERQGDDDVRALLARLPDGLLEQEPSVQSFEVIASKV